MIDPTKIKIGDIIQYDGNEFIEFMCITEILDDFVLVDRLTSNMKYRTGTAKLEFNYHFKSNLYKLL